MTNTRSLPLSVPLPEGFTAQTIPGGRIAAKDSEREALAATGVFDPARIEQAGEPTSLGGRGSLRRLPLPSGAALLRRFHHGGLLRAFTGARFRDWERPFRELVLTAAVREAGLAAPEPLAAVAMRRFFFYELFYLSREVGGEDLACALREPDSVKRLDLLSRVGREIRRFHDAGFFHFDLHPKNLLVEKGSEKIFFLDLDRSQRFPSLTREQRVANLERLYRYGLRAQALRGEQPWSQEQCRALLEAYEPGDKEALWREILQVFQRRGGLHRIGWKLEKLF